MHAVCAEVSRRQGIEMKIQIPLPNDYRSNETVMWCLWDREVLKCCRCFVKNKFVDPLKSIHVVPRTMEANIFHVTCLEEL